jgi:hypothetical protein
MPLAMREHKKTRVENASSQMAPTGGLHGIDGLAEEDFFRRLCERVPRSEDALRSVPERVRVRGRRAGFFSGAGVSGTETLPNLPKKTQVRRSSPAPVKMFISFDPLSPANRKAIAFHAPSSVFAGEGNGI